MAHSEGIRLKKKFGQHFLRDPLIPDAMINAVEIKPTTSVFEIGCGDGYLTRAILETKIARLQIFEIDPEWANYVRQLFSSDARLNVSEANFLDINLADTIGNHAPWTVLANLPYQITFPILYKFHEFRFLLKEGVIMVQEEVAQKITKTRGRGYGFVALFFQHFFEWKMLNKIPPLAFFPPPKVHSRLLYFKPRKDLEPIVREEEFWKFIKVCFQQPRRTMRNNLMHTKYSIAHISEEILSLRAQQMDYNQLISLWNQLIQS